MFKNPMNFIYRAALSAAFVLLLAPQAAAQSPCPTVATTVEPIPFRAYFDNDEPNSCGITWGGGTGSALAAAHQVNTHSSTLNWRVYTNGNGKDLGGSTNPSNGTYLPHMVSTNATFNRCSFQKSGNRSFSIVSKTGTFNNPASTSQVYTPGTVNYVMLPPMNSSLNILKFSFWFCTNTSTAGQLEVGYVTADGTGNDATSVTTFVAVATFNASSESVTTTGGLQAAGVGKDVEVSFASAPANATRIALRWVNNTSTLAVCNIDNLEVDYNVTCLPVTNLQETDVQYDRASISWTDLNSASRWQVSLNGGSPVTVTSTDYTFTGLTHNTEYTAQVKSVCSDDDISNPTEITFRTVACSPVANLVAVPNYTSAALTWSDVNSATQWQVSLDGGSPVTVSSPSHTFTGLAPNTDYTATVRAVCAPGVLSDPVTVNFTTVCPQPTSLAIDRIDGDELHLMWNGIASQYEVQLASDNAFSSGLRTATGATTGTSFDGLTVGEYYYARVRALCGSDYSAWSNVLEVYFVDLIGSAPETGLYESTGTVVLNDLEPHDWKIYTTEVDKPLRSLNPLDVKITYRGHGTANVSSNITYTEGNEDMAYYVPVQMSEFTANCSPSDVSVGISPEERHYHTLVYYKTLDRLNKNEGTGRVEYRTIFNPFSRRPTFGNPADYNLASNTFALSPASYIGAPCWRGFYMWRIDRISGGSVYTTKTGGTPLAVGDVIKADKALYFEASSTLELEFTALWAPAAVRYTVGPSMAWSHHPSKGWGQFAERDIAGIERNFVVLNGVFRLTGPVKGTDWPQLIVEAGNPNGSEWDYNATYTSVFPNGTYDGVTPAYGPVKTATTTPTGVERVPTYIDLCPGLTKQDNRVVTICSDVRFEYLAFSRLRGERNAFFLDGTPAATWGTIATDGTHNLTLGRGIETMFDDNLGTFNYIWGFGPLVNNNATNAATWGFRRDADNYVLTSGGVKINSGVNFGNEFPTREVLTRDLDITIRLESGYVGCLMTIYGWNANYQTQEGNDMTNIFGDGKIETKTTPSHRADGTDNHVRFIMGTDYDRADEAQKVRNLGTDYASHTGPDGQPYATLDSMLYHEVYKNAKTKIYRPFRVGNFNGNINHQDKDSVYSEMIIKSGFVGQEIIDREIGHMEGSTAAGRFFPDKTVHGVTFSGNRLSWTPKSIYNCVSANNIHRGKRRMLIEGGMLNCCVSLGAWDRTNDLSRWAKQPGTTGASGIFWDPYRDGDETPNDVSTLRMTGGIITGALFGGGNTYTASGGGRQMIITGGVVRAWVSGGVNGGDANVDQWEGIHYGNAWIYAGGNFHVGSGDTTHTTVGDSILFQGNNGGINGSTDGNIFGAGCGIRPIQFNTSGPISTDWNENAYKFHRMGRIDSSFVYVADNVVVEGDVYGGGNFGYNNTGNGLEEALAKDKANKIGQSGGSDTTKDSRAKGMATLRILGGEVGGRVFGGSNQKMSRMADIRMTGGLVKRGIYGGCNTWGFMTESVTLDILGGTVGTPELPGVVCGGGLGKETAVFKDVTLNFGAAGTDGPTIYGDIYGGSQQGTTNGGSITRTQIGTYLISGYDYPIYLTSIDTSEAQGQGYNTNYRTTVNFYSGRHLGGAIFGGAWGPDNAFATVYGDVEVNILGGQVNDVFGANDATGKPMGRVKVNIGTPDSVAASTADGNKAHRNRPLVTGSVYGGGRNASYGSGKDNYIPVVDMYSGTVMNNVFGGGQGSTAVIDHPAENYSTKVHIHHGTVMGNVYGGGNDAKVLGNTRVIIGVDATTAYTLTVTTADASMGTVTGGGTVLQDQDVQIKATPKAGYRFTQWHDGNTSNPRYIAINSDTTYIAQFEAIVEYTITVTSADDAMGTASGGGNYDVDQVAVITAAPADGYRFTGWSDGSSFNPRHVTVSGDATFTAQFEALPKYQITATANNTAMGTVTGSGEFTVGQSTQLRATPNAGYKFVRWADSGAGWQNASRYVLVEGTKSYTAIFEAVTP